METKKLQSDIESALTKWLAPKTLQYRETQSGQISKLTADSAPPVDESSPRVLTAWLIRALRPTVALPARPLNLGEHWQESRVVQFAEWTATSGSEAGEWLAPPAGVRQRGEPTIKLQTTQEITGTVTGGTEKPAEGSAAAHFHAESLSTLAFNDLRLMSASRSATRDILWTLAPVEGLEKPPQYRGRLFVEISIQVCDETPCSMPNGNSGGCGRYRQRSDRWQHRHSCRRALLNSSLVTQSSSIKSSGQKSTTVPQRITLTPQYLQGQVIRYQMQATTVTDAHHGGAIRDPQGSTKLTVVWNAVTRLEVLSIEKNAQGNPTGTMRLRST